MSIEEIRKNAPKDATHYHKNMLGVKYYKRGKRDQLFSVCVDNVWIPSFIDPYKPKPLY